MRDRRNILNTDGMLTDEQRKEPLEHGCNYFTFSSCLDLSKGVTVSAYGISGIYSIEQYSQDLSIFMCWWEHFVKKDLNGSGFSHIKFNLVGFELKQ